jgi:hypothetical protein
MLSAAKFWDDIYYNNAFWAKIGGVSSLELNNLELEFLFSVNFDLAVTADEYDKYKQELLTHGVGGSPITETPMDCSIQMQFVHA